MAMLARNPPTQRREEPFFHCVEKMACFFHSVENIFPYRGKIQKKFSILWKTFRERRPEKIAECPAWLVRITCEMN